MTTFSIPKTSLKMPFVSFNNKTAIIFKKIVMKTIWWGRVVVYLKLTNKWQNLTSFIKPKKYQKYQFE